MENTKKVKYQKKYIVLLLMIGVFAIIGFGCNSNPIVPVVPGINPNPSTNPENSTVSYIEVTAASSTIKVNQSLQLTVRGYNSNDEWVILDKSKIKLWDWSVIGQCYICVKPYVNLSPQSSSLTTTFSSRTAGIFYVAAYYQEKIGDEYITDYTQIEVVN